jgi:DNA-binding transcriptional ArsR family regulator
MPDRPALTHPQLIKVLAHPTRVHVLTILNERTASPSEIAQQIGRDVKHVGYHIKELEKLGCIELVEVKPVWGGRTQEHFYRALQRPWFDREAWAQVDPEDQPGVTSAIMERMNEDISNAIIGGTINDRENHISRTPMIVDPESYEEIVELMNSTLERALKIQELATARLNSSKEAILTKVHLIQFVSPNPGDQGKATGDA